MACTDESTSGGMFSTDCRLLGRVLDSQAYKNEGWVSWVDWLGKPPVGTFLVFEAAREVARTQKISNWEEVRRHPFDSSLSTAVVSKSC